MLTVKQKLGQLAVATCSLSLVATSAQAVVIFNESQTGLELFNNADVTFPSNAPIINGSSIDFDDGSLGEALMVWDLLPAAPRGELDISIAIDYTPLSPDNDPFFTIFDGRNYLALVRREDSGGEILLVRGAATTTALLDFTIDATPVSGLGPVEPFSYDLWIADGGGGPASVNNFVEGADGAPGSFPYQGSFLDTDNALSFALYRSLAASTGEQYRINSIAITIEEKGLEAVPEPATLLGILTVLGLGLMHKSRVREQ